MANLRLAFRTLLKTPFVTIVAIVSLALGIGANAAIFSLFDQILLRSLPVHEPDRLVNLGAPGPKPGSTSCGNQGPCSDIFSYPMFRDLERVQSSFEGLAAHRAFGANLAYRGQTMNGDGMSVSGSYFPLLGVRPALGRLLTPDDDVTVGGHFVVVLSEAYWRTRFEANPNVLNETLMVNGQAMTIVGVAARGFHGTSLGTRPHVYVPIAMRGLMEPGFVRPTPNGNGFEGRRNYWAYVFGRLKPGVSIEAARTAINGPYRAILNDVEVPLQVGMSEQTMARFKAKEITIAEGYRGQSEIHHEARTPLYLLLGVTGFVLLIACANIANLLLARAAGRAGEIAVRLSVGASRRQLVMQLLTESLLLAVLGGVVGLLVSRWTLDLMASLLPSDASATIDFAVDRSAVIWAGVLAIGTGLLFGLFPAFHSTRPDLVTTLKDQAGQKGSSKAASRFRAGLATAQIALSMTLLVAAGLFTRSLLNVSRVDLGIRIDNVITFALFPQLNGYTSQRTAELFERLEDQFAALPGVTGVTASTVGVVAGNNWGTGVSVQGFEAGPDTDIQSNFTLVGPAYFRTLGVPLLAGREFTRADAIGAPQVAIVNEEFARKFNLGRDAVGKRMMNDRRANALEIEIVGLVQNAKYSQVKQAFPPVFYLPYRQDERLGFINFYVRTAGNPDALLPTVNSVVAKLDANLPLENLKTLQQQVQENVFLDRMIGTLSSAFAILATLLAAIGLYGVLAYTVAQRTREIGLRMALGADGRRVRGMVLTQVLWMTIVGGVVGIAAAVGLGQLAQSLLFELRGYDPMVLSVSAVLLGLVALGAGFVPARRASRIDPMLALRYE
jgi:putative ABC transport system permease protein